MHPGCCADATDLFTAEVQQLLGEFGAGLRGYTYLED
ncbi:hypothetical protein [Sedimenticola selenatireducens]